MVFGLFKKKKPKQDKSQDSHHEDKSQEDKKSKSKSKSKSTKEAAPEHKPEDGHHIVSPSTIPQDNPNADQWIFDGIVQFIESPNWRTPILIFLDSHCSVFDDLKKDKPEYVEIHEDFKDLAEKIVSEMLVELEITEAKFFEVIKKGIKDPYYKTVFEQLFLCENFKIFKKIMYSRNKELELEALQELHEIDKKKSGHGSEQLKKANEADIKKLGEEKEQAEVEQAIAISKAMEEERRKLQEQEEYELQEALKQSKAEYSHYQEVQKEKEIQKLRELKLEEERKAKEEEERQKELKKQELEKRQKEHKIEEEEKHGGESHRGGKKFAHLQNALLMSSKIQMEEKLADTLPPLKGSGLFNKSAQEEWTKEQQKDKESSQILENSMIFQSHPETPEERKKRLQAQRDVILAKKKAEREEELRRHEEKKAAKLAKEGVNKKPVVEDKAQKDELTKRRELYALIKDEL